jgi:hypothetical protein
MKTIVTFFIASFILVFTAGLIQAGEKDPVAVLFQVKGDVEYTKNGQVWKKIRRNKFLFAGYQIRSLGDGSGKLTIKTTGVNMMLGPNTVLEVTDTDLNVKKGDLSESEQSNQLVSGLVKKFSKSQSYTTVRRSASTNEFDAVRSVVVSDEHPYLVWDNLDQAYSYKLKVGEDVYQIAATKDGIIRAKIKPFSGTKDFTIMALKDNKAVAEIQPYKSRGETKDHTVSWLEKAQQEELNQVISGLTEEYGEDTFILGTYYEKMDMWVAAMDQYKKYLQENPDDVEMTPYLFRVYKKLKLEETYQKELNQWTQAMAE